MNREKLVNREKWDAGEYCVVCGSPYVERHHIFPGSSRRASDKFGYIVPLCRFHHTGDKGIHFDPKMALWWKETAQAHFERHVGSREEFIRNFGRSYL